MWAVGGDQLVVNHIVRTPPPRLLSLSKPCHKSRQLSGSKRASIEAPSLLQTDLDICIMPTH